MGDCLNTATDNIFISCPIIELINGVYMSERKREGVKVGLPRPKGKGGNCVTLTLGTLDLRMGTG